MTRRLVRAAVSVGAMLTLTACAAEKSSNPLSPTVAGPIPGVGITAPGIMQPANGSKIRNDQQPVTLTVSNSTTTGVRPLRYRFEVATDAEFSSLVFTRADVEPGDGQTSLRLPDALAPERSYYWRARAEDGANTSAYSNLAAFNVFSPALFQQPAPVTPINNAVVSSLRPTFTWTNAGRTGTVEGTVVYTVELSDTAAFTGTVSATVAEQAGQTSINPPQDLPSNRQGYWRVRAADSNSTGPWSAIQTFRTPAPPPTDGGGGGGGTGGSACSWPGAPAYWTTSQWHDCFFALVAAKGAGPTVTVSAMTVLRPDLNARGAEWQHDSFGNLRPRLFLPVPNCPSAADRNAQVCSYSRAVDMGDLGGGMALDSALVESLR